MRQQTWLRWSPWVVVCVVGTRAAALGFDAVPGSVGLGAPLDLAIPLRLDPGETVEAGCVRADVRIGDRPVDPADLAVALETAPGGAKLRLRSRATVGEPLVAVQVAIECAAPMVRRFVLLADPPRAGSDAPVAVPGAEAAQAIRPAATPAPPGVAPRREAPGPARTTGRDASARGGTGGPPTPRAAAGDAPASVTRPQARDVAPAQKSAQPASPAKRPVETPAGLAGDAPGPHAQEQEHAQALAREVDALRSQNLVLQQTIERLRRSSTPGERERFESSAWLPLVVLALLSTWLGFRWQSVRRARRPAIGPGAEPTPGAQRRTATPGAAPQRRHDLQDDEQALRTAAGPAGPQAAGGFAVDDLVDLDQQVDFFVVLGDDDAALAMLDAQLDAPAGASPLAWLRLLGLLHRRGDRDAYRRIGERLTRRFGVEPPTWARGPESGRGLAGCTPLIEELQVAWPNPAAALRLLESVLRRRPGTPWLDLPALRDALLLYAVARDLRRRDETETPQVDLWLPLPAQAAAGANAARR